MKKTLITILIIVLMVTLVTQIPKAIGSLTPYGTAGDATQYTLNDIYTRLTANTSTSTKSGMFSTPGSVTATFRTLTEIYSSIPTINATTVASGMSYLGVMGTKQDGVVYPTQWSVDNPLGYIDWATAVSYCDSLTENSHTDWRLPSYIELINAFLTTNPGNSLGFQVENYWSSTDYPDFTSNVYGVQMGYGDAGSGDKTIPNAIVRCTR